jgi:hypothetical protein
VATGYPNEGSLPMAARKPQTFAKHQREQAVRERRERKREKRAERAAERAATPPAPDAG